MLFISAVFLLALLISLLFLPLYKSKGLSTIPLLLFFVILFIAGLSSRFRIVPFGPVLWGVSWLPPLLILIVFAFLFAIPSLYQHATKAHDKNDEAENNLITTNIFVWFLLGILLIALAIGYYNTFNL
jgi:hypothetical protein